MAWVHTQTCRTMEQDSREKIQLPEFNNKAKAYQKKASSKNDAGKTMFTCKRIKLDILSSCTKIRFK